MTNPWTCTLLMISSNPTRSLDPTEPVHHVVPDSIPFVASSTVPATVLLRIPSLFKLRMQRTICLLTMERRSEFFSSSRSGLLDRDWNDDLYFQLPVGSLDLKLAIAFAILEKKI
ncbi:putative serine protease [Corchorus capsularis]|uniref:Putative serine protease n=1 Tax=Corchorus capsularis TaxID=210143 RepID=A0A1R3JJT8_COCAP|nr:putative serine protease [Corchorus capsularis]